MRLVGFTLSPILWRKLPGAKSAGRVQSVALRLIVDREREIELFNSQEYWSVTATLAQEGTEFLARLVRFDGDKIDRLTIGDEGTAMRAKAYPGEDPQTVKQPAIVGERIAALAAEGFDTRHRERVVNPA